MAAERESGERALWLDTRLYHDQGDGDVPIIGLFVPVIFGRSGLGNPCGKSGAP